MAVTSEEEMHKYLKIGNSNRTVGIYFTNLRLNFNEFIIKSITFDFYNLCGIFIEKLRNLKTYRLQV